MCFFLRYALLFRPALKDLPWSPGYHGLRPHGLSRRWSYDEGQDQWMYVAACRCILSTEVLCHFIDTSSNPHVDGITHTRLPGCDHKEMFVRAAQIPWFSLLRVLSSADAELMLCSRQLWVFLTMIAFLRDSRKTLCFRPHRR